MMGDIEDMAMKVVNAYEDLYFEKEKRSTFESILSRYIPMVDPEGDMDLYGATVALGRQHPPEFGQMFRALKDRALVAE
jgi:hypothetical protein